jgi:transposase
MAKKHVVELTDEERQALGRLVGTGRDSARKIIRARVLLMADEGQTDEEIADGLGVSVGTAERVRRRFAEGGVGAAVERRPQPPRPGKRVLDGDAEARLTALACSRPPDGYGRWTLDLLADRLVKLDVVPAVSGDTVGRCLKKVRPSRGSSTSGASRRPAGHS